MNVSLVGQTLIVNQVLMSSLWYFIIVWARTKKHLGEIKALLCNYLWYGSENMIRAHVSWDNYMMPKKVGGLSLISLEDAMRAFMCKWIIQTLLPGKLNLQIIVRYYITYLQSSYHGLWVFFPCGCSPQISLPKVNPKFGTTLVNRGK